MNQDSRIVVVALVLILGGGGAWFWWRRQKPPAPPPAPVPTQPVAAPVRPAPDAAPEPAIRHPIEPAAARPNRALPPLDESDAQAKDALDDLFGRKAVASLFNLTGFVRGFVATVDNLATERPQSQLWPVKPTAGNFVTDARGETTVIGAGNAARYAPLVRAATAVDTGKAVAVYRWLYPLFQQAYDDLGYSGKYFNDRVIQVIDHLLATPEPTGPIPVKRIEVEGGTRPGGLYQFADPGLERRSAGQKILLRVGPENAERLKQKLADVREQIARR